jgi:hypothetical protein
MTVGLRFELDTDINSVDGANLSINNGTSTVLVTTIYRIADNDLPSEWWGYDIPPPGIAGLVVTGSNYNNPYGSVATEPDAFEIAYWPDVEGSGLWSIGPPGVSIWDSSVVYWWTGNGDETVGNYILNAGQSKTLITYVGLNQIALLSTPTNTPTCTPTGPSATPTNTFTPTTTPTITATSTKTFTSTVTLTPTITSTPTNTPTPTNTATVTTTFTPTSSATPTCEVHAWPNPFMPSYAWNGVFQLSCLESSDTVSFYTVSGELVDQMNASGAMVQWKGINTNGNKVATGIYLWVVQRSGKTIQMGKFLIER